MNGGGVLITGGGSVSGSGIGGSGIGFSGS